MKKTLLITILPLVFILNAKSQVNIPNSDFSGGIKTTCDYDTNRIIHTFKEWEGYQTYDSLWWGVRDSTSCFDIADTVNNYGNIYYDEVKQDESVFIRYRFNDSNAIALDTNNIYSFSLQFYPSTGDYSLIDTSGNCPDNLCSGLQIGIQIPDSFGTGKTMRWYSGRLSNVIPYGPVFQSCFPTERFINGNYLRELIIKYTTGGSIPQGFTIQPNYLRADYPNPNVSQIRSVDASNKVSNRHYEYDLGGFPQDYLVMYTDTTYPSPAHQSYVDVKPSPNTSTQDTVDVVVEHDSYLTFQPYTELRGGLISGNDSLRHIVNLINYGTMCIPFIEVVMTDGNNFIYRAGEINMAGERTCMGFTKGSKLIVDDNAVLNYGMGGQGILAITTGGTIEIRKNAELRIHDMLAINEGSAYNTPQQIYMTLNAGSKLTFMPGSHLNNMYSIGQKMKLNIYMKGGILDDSGLSLGERSLINRIYDSPLEAMLANLHVYGNPFKTDLVFSFTFADATNFLASLYSIEGKLIETNTFAAQEGINYYDWNMSSISNGIYLLRIEAEAGSVTTRIIKMGNQ